MKCLQCNIQSISTSLPLLRLTAERLNIDVILLQEIWNPTEGSFSIKNFLPPLTKIRTGKVGGGVAIGAHKRVRLVHLKEFDVPDLEAIWAEICVGKVRTVIGSIYIPPGDIDAIDLLDDVISRILVSHSNIIICMDANSRHALWDNSCIGIPHCRQSIKMGIRLEHIIDKYDLLVHNNGIPTYRSGDIATAPDVTITKGLSQYGNMVWSVLDDDLRTPHESIMFQVGDHVQGFRKEIIDWRVFDWEAYKEATCKALNVVYDKWSSDDNLCVNAMSKEISDTLHACVNDVATKKVITQHSRPWINPDISLELKKLRKLRNKCRLRRSPRNTKQLKELQETVADMISRAENEWWFSECEKIAKSSEREKWRIIERLTNQSHFNEIQPIRKDNNGKASFLFSDDDILHELENHHIRKSSLCQSANSSRPISVNNVAGSTLNNSIDIALNAEITDYEVSLTFGKGSNTAGPDGISATMIDKADRDLMHSCLRMLWNKAWLTGVFVSSWKEENRVVIRKLGKDDYHDCNAYRTISITSCLGKRFEHVTSQRLISILTELHFDKTSLHTSQAEVPHKQY